MNSLHRRLVLTLLSGLLLGGIAGGISLYWEAMEELDEVFDDRLQTLAANLRPETLAGKSPIESTEEDDDIVIQYWNAEGRLQFHSGEARYAPPPMQTGFSDLPPGAADWRSYARRTDDGGLLQVAQEMEARRDQAAATAFRVMLPLSALLPLLAAFTAWTVSRQLRPMRVLADQLQGRGAMTQSAIVVPDAPLELAPVVTALNELLGRQAEAARRQADFLADAAHELRTPLAVVSLQAQRARQAASEPERQESIAALCDGAERATRLVTQLLALSRSDASAHAAGHRAPIELDTLLKSVLAEIFPLATQKKIDLGLTESCPCVIDGDVESLRSLIVNLVDNAIRYTPAGGKVNVALTTRDRTATILISDTGPGIAAERRRRVFERFVRGGSADIGGTGLGLAIARQAAERNGGAIALDEGEGGRGLAVRVTLPIAG